MGWSVETEPERGDEEQERAPQRADVYRILVYPNITYARNLEADSYVVVVGSVIRALADVRDDLRFTMLVPDRIRSLELPNVEQIIYPLPTYPNLMRTHFDAPALARAIDWRNRSYDVVWSHLPEHTLALKNLFYNSTNERSVFVGYSHWAEIPQNTAYPETMFPTNVAGMLAENFCGVNSIWCKRLLIDEAGKFLNEQTLAELDRIVRPQYLGCDLPDVGEVTPEPGLLVWNHRLSTYTGFNAALDALDALWGRRQDFRVLFTLGGVDRPYAAPTGIQEGPGYRESYLRAVARGWLGLGRAGYAPWSVAVMDGLNLGLPYVLPRDSCYPEVVGGDYPLLYQTSDELVAKIEYVLDNPDLRGKLSEQARMDGERFSWANCVRSFSLMFDEAFAGLWTLGSRTAKYEEIERLALADATKREIIREVKWGVGRPFTPYRNRLRVEGVPLAGT